MKTATRAALVADADATSGAAIAEHLWQLGFTAKLTHSGADALAAAAEHTFDVALVDIDLPDFSGHALSREFLRSHEFPVIVVTDSSNIDHAIVALRNGAADFLRKPVRLPQLDRALVAALDVRDKPPAKKPPVTTPTRDLTPSRKSSAREQLGPRQPRVAAAPTPHKPKPKKASVAASPHRQGPNRKLHRHRTARKGEITYA